MTTFTFVPVISPLQHAIDDAPRSDRSNFEHAEVKMTSQKCVGFSEKTNTKNEKCSLCEPRQGQTQI